VAVQYIDLVDRVVEVVISGSDFRRRYLADADDLQLEIGAIYGSTWVKVGLRVALFSK